MVYGYCDSCIIYLIFLFVEKFGEPSIYKKIIKRKRISNKIQIFFRIFMFSNDFWFHRWIRFYSRNRGFDSIFIFWKKT